MTKRIDLRTLIGGFFLVAALLLASPGVRVAQGESDPATMMSQVPVVAPADPALCPAEMAPQRTAEAMARARAALAAAPDDGDVVVLNGRGFNYPQPVRADPAAVEFEALQERRTR